MEALMETNPTIGLSASSTKEKTKANNHYPVIDRRESLSTESFFTNYVLKNRPVVVSGALRNCQALSQWETAYLRKVSGSRTVTLKQGLIEEGVANLKTVTTQLNDYLDQVEVFEIQLQKKEVSTRDRPPYLHDLPLLSVLPNAANDLVGFPSDYFPEWYRSDWIK